MSHSLSPRFFSRVGTILLILIGYAIVVQQLSYTFDGDFGWHVRFGRDVSQGATFPYLDTYTWTNQGLPWINHEWGSDILWWMVVSSAGYMALVGLVAAAWWGALLLALRLTGRRLTIATVTLAMLSLWSVLFLVSVRPGMFAPLFFVCLWYSLIALPERRTYYLWPVLFWLWAAMHGSWILGFALIGAYSVGYGLAHALRHHPNWAGRPIGWTQTTLKQVVLWAVISGATLCLNPYGIHIWTEVLHYFQYPFFQTVINEWLPSYAYPVYWWPLAIGAVSLVSLGFGWRERRVSWPEVLVFLGIGFAALEHKRHNVFLALVCLPILLETASIFWSQFPRAWFPRRRSWAALRLALPLTLVCLSLVLVGIVSRVRWIPDVWADTELLFENGFPAGATAFIAEATQGQKTYLFNEFRWGGYLNWALPEALVYLDGRGTATWLYTPEQTWLAHYRQVKFAPGGLLEIDRSPVQFIILSAHQADYPSPDTINQVLFSPTDLAQVMTREESRLEKDLLRSSAWDLVYEDAGSRVWQRRY